MKQRLIPQISDIAKWLPELAVLFVCIVFMSIGIAHKEGYHMDELLSFELSNAEYNPWIVPTQPEGRLAKFIHNEIDGETPFQTIGNLIDTVKDVVQNRGNSKLLSYQADIYEEPVWISSDQFRDYVSVDQEDDFNFLSVYFNVKDDNHPPVHFMLLHAVSSIFRGQTAPIIGCIINLAAMAATMVLLMKIGPLLAELLGIRQQGRFLGLFAAFLYGSAAGTMASVLLIRMYCVVSGLCIALFYIHIRKWRDGFDKGNKWLIAVTVLGFLTQYFFLFYCIVLAVVTVVLLIWEKKNKALLSYIRALLIAAIIGLACFPFAVSDVLSSERGTEALANLTSGLKGYGTRLADFWNILTERTFGKWAFVLLAVLVGVGYTFAKSKTSVGKDSAVKDVAECQERNLYKMAGGMGMLVLPVIGYFLLAAKMSPYLVDRYIMPVFPFVLLICAVLIVWASVYLEKEQQKKKLLYVICTCVMALHLYGLLGYDGSYLYQGYAKQLQASEAYGYDSCICVYDGVGYYENLPEFANYEKTLLLTEEQLADRIDTEAVTSLPEVVLLVKEEVDWQRVSLIMQEKYGFSFEKELIDNSVHGDKLLLFVGKK